MTLYNIVKGLNSHFVSKNERFLARFKIDFIVWKLFIFMKIIKISDGFKIDFIVWKHPSFDRVFLYQLMFKIDFIVWKHDWVNSGTFKGDSLKLTL